MEINILETTKKVLRKQITEAEQCTKDDYILAYVNHQLGIRFNDRNQPTVCSIADASSMGDNNQPEEAWSYVPTVVNKSGEKAKLVIRQNLLAKDIEKMKQHLQKLEAVGNA